MPRLLLLLWCAAVARGYTGSDDRFVKKYAMMKVYESCFGPEVVREVRQEMRAASAKCQERAQSPILSFSPAFGQDRLDRPHPPLRTHRPHHHQQQQQQQADSSRLQQALMAVLNRQAGGGLSAYRPVQQPQPAAAAAALQQPQGPIGPVGYSSAPGFSSSPSGLSSGLSDLLTQYQGGGASAAPAPSAGPGVYQAMPQVDPLQALQALQVLQQYQSRGSSSHFHYQQPQQQPQQQPAYYQQAFGNRYSRSSRASKAMADPSAASPAASSAASSAASPEASAAASSPTAASATPSPRSTLKAKGSGRTSRDLDVQGQLETLTTRMTGRVKNVTCVMQELGYLDSALEPDFERIAARISRLPVSSELRRDMLEGVQFCRQFSQCIPDSRRDKFLLSGELLRPMFFFRCYKHKKLEACIMKDVRERYQQAAVDDNLLPNTRAIDLDRDGDADRESLDEDHMAAAVYEFLYGGDNLDADSFF